MLPIVLLVCAVLAMMVPEWGWPVALVCVGGAMIGRHEDVNVEKAYAEAEAAGVDMSGDRRSDFGCGLILAVLFLAPFLLYFFGR